MKKPPKSHTTFNDFFTLSGLILGCTFLLVLKNGWSSDSVWEKLFVSLMAIGSFSVAFSRRARYILGAIFFGVGAIFMLYLSATNWEWNIDHILLTVLIFCIFSIPCAFLIAKGLERRRVRQRILIQQIDCMSGSEFEQFCADILRKNGFYDVRVMGGSGDQGVDIVARKGKSRYAIQCKCYSNKLGNTPVQEVFAGRIHYGCDVAAVMTNNYFTPGAIELARSTGVFLWDRDWVNSHLPPTKQKKNTLKKHCLKIRRKDDDVEYDPVLTEAIIIVVESGSSSVASLQEKLNLEPGQAERFLGQMEKLGVVGPFQAGRPRDVLMSPENASYQKLRRVFQKVKEQERLDLQQATKEVVTASSGGKTLDEEDMRRIIGEELKWRRQQITDSDEE